MKVIPDNVVVSVIVPTHNRSDALSLTLSSLSKQRFSGSWEVIIVNNNSTDDTAAVVQNWQKTFPVKICLIYEEKPGAAAARNAGAKAAQGKYLVFIDNDILVKPDFIERHFRALKENTGCWIVGAIANLPEQEDSSFGRFRKSLLDDIHDDSEIREVTISFTGANSSMPRADFERLGGFDEGFYVASGEDQELAMRARKEFGIKALYVPQIIGIHNDWAGWTFADFCRRQEIYARTEYIFWQKYGDSHPRLQMLLESLPVDQREDSFNLKTRKIGKRVLENGVVQKVLLTIANLLEKHRAFRPLLWQTYKLRLAGAINKGLREGRNHYLSKE